ncbi:hypothetical protein FKM82_008744 [Ascaphus truei]
MAIQPCEVWIVYVCLLCPSAIHHTRMLQYILIIEKESEGRHRVIGLFEKSTTLNKSVWHNLLVWQKTCSKPKGAVAFGYSAGI